MVKRRFDLDVQAAIMELVAVGDSDYTAKQIHDFLDSKEEFSGRVPHERTIHRMIKEHGPGDSSESWHWSDYGSNQARAVLDALLAVIRWGDDMDADTGIEAFIDWLNQSEIPYSDPADNPEYSSKVHGDWIARLSGVADGIGPIPLYLIAKSYVVESAMGFERSGGLDMLVAAKPWDSLKALERYRDDLARGVLPVPNAEGLYHQFLFGIAYDLYLRGELPCSPSPRETKPMVRGE